MFYTHVYLLNLLYILCIIILLLSIHFTNLLSESPIDEKS